MESNIPKQLSINKIVNKVIELLDPEGYDNYSEYEEAVSNALQRLGYKGIIIPTGIRNAVRERREFLKPQIQEMEKKINFLQANRNRLNIWNKGRFSLFLGLTKDKYTITHHTILDKILDSNFGEEELEEYNIKTYKR